MYCLPEKSHISRAAVCLSVLLFTAPLLFAKDFNNFDFTRHVLSGTTTAKINRLVVASSKNSFRQVKTKPDRTTVKIKQLVVASNQNPYIPLFSSTIPANMKDLAVTSKSSPADLLPTETKTTVKINSLTLASARNFTDHVLSKPTPMTRKRMQASSAKKSSTNIQIHKPVIVPAGKNIAGAFLLTSAGAAAVSQSTVQQSAKVHHEEETADEMYGTAGGYLHGYLSVRGEYTDNVYNIDVDETDNFLTVISPGIWIGYPKTKEIIASLSPHNPSIGGIRSTQIGSGAFNRFKAYLLAGMDHKIYSANSDLDSTVWRIKGMFQYALPAGLSFRLSDQYTRDRDRLDIGSFLPQDFTVDQDGNAIVSSTPSRIRDFYSNRAILDIYLTASERFDASFTYTNFILNYDENINNWLDRTDNVFSGSLYYNHSHKTSLFATYSQAFVTYDSTTSNDSEYLNLFGGIRWRGSPKTTLSASGGYQVKKYENIEWDDFDTFIMSASLNYLITDKTKIGINLSKSLEEADSLTNRGKDSTTVKLSYSQRFNQRLRGYCNFLYQYNDYEGFNRRDNNPFFTNEARKDTFFRVKPAVQYQFRDWLMTELAYSFENRNSNDEIYDFTSQTVFLSLNAAF